MDEMKDMSLRDYFAGKALSALLDDETVADLVDVRENSREGRAPFFEGVARMCYEAADAMLREREGGSDE